MADSNIPLVTSTHRDPEGMFRQVRTSLARIQYLFNSAYSGEHTPPNTATVFTVSYFDEGLEDQEDADYSVFVNAVDFTGSPPREAFIIKIAAGDIDHFDVEMAAAAGAGNSITWGWQLLRFV